MISRPRGWGKSPFLAAIACVEGLGPVLFDGWDANGQPVGKPWSEVRTPLVQVAAVSEAQTKNSWTPLLEMLDGPALDNYPGLEILDTFVNLPRGRIEPVTSSPSSLKGNKAVFAILDQTEEWRPSNGGVRMAEVMRINASKLGGSTIESPNAYTPGEGSVAEQSAEYWKRIVEGRARDDGLLYDHREAPPETDMTDRKSLLAGLAYVYGDSANVVGGWVDLERIVADIWDPATHPQVARADFLNQITHAADSWISQPEWAAVAAPQATVTPGDEIVLGFDGSRRRSHSVTDATALVGCRVSDGHLFLLGCWEQPDGPFGADWQVPTTEVLATVEDAFKTYRVVGMYADPARWESHVASWEAKHGKRLKVKAGVQHPIEWWMTGGRSVLIVRALEKFRSSVVDGELTHDGSSVLTRHILNARRRSSRSGIQIMKEHPESPRKIDAAIAAVLAWQCRVDAMAKGLGTKKKAGSKGRVVVLR
ncbi:terminase [Streptomyces sp. enrichment culture]|uniref:terminase n=1 Tax=Streptomyces sp. enrichment culture TaxID=1795815 RepID=UPI003F567E5A